MKRFFRYLFIGIGAVCTFAVITFVAFYLYGTHIISNQRAVCLESEDFVAIKATLKKSLEDGTIDQRVIDRENEGIAGALEECANGNKDKSRSMLTNIMIDTELQSDNVYARKINEKQDKKIQPNK